MTQKEYGKAYQLGFNHTVRFLLSRGCASTDWAIEIAQAAWAKGWERLYQLRNDSMVVTWVNTIALNAHRGVLRKDGGLQPLAEFGGETSINLAAIELVQVLKNCPPRDRALLESQMRGETAKEIAREHGVTETAIRIRLLRARRTARAWANGKVSRLLESNLPMTARCDAA